jgi:hypothetical protein
MLATERPSSSRALVPTEQAHEANPHRPVQRISTFLAQLIATARKVPQACEKRRADPAEVIAAYRATVARLQPPNEKAV